MPMTNKLILPVESRMQGDLHVRFGGRLWETYHRKVVRRPLPSLLKCTIKKRFFVSNAFVYSLLPKGNEQPQRIC